VKKGRIRQGRSFSSVPESAFVEKRRGGKFRKGGGKEWAANTRGGFHREGRTCQFFSEDSATGKRVQGGDWEFKKHFVGERNGWSVKKRPPGAL